MSVYPGSRGSGVRAIGGRKFFTGKVSGRNESEPRRSLVNYKMEMPTLCVDREGRCAQAQKRKRPERSSGVAGAACSGRYTVQCWRSNMVMTEENQPSGIRRRNPGGPSWNSEGSIVPLEGKDNITVPEGRDPALFRQLKSGG